MATVQVAVTEGGEVADYALGDHQGKVAREGVRVGEAFSVFKGGTYTNVYFDPPSSFEVVNPFNYVELWTKDDG